MEHNDIRGGHPLKDVDFFTIFISGVLHFILLIINYFQTINFCHILNLEFRCYSPVCIYLIFVIRGDYFLTKLNSCIFYIIVSAQTGCI